MNNKIKDAYMRAYLYELEKALNENQQILENVKFQSDEANTDREVKIAIKKFINNNLTKISKIKHVEIDGVQFDLNLSSFSMVAKTSDDYTYDDRMIVKKQKSSVYVNPDMILFCRIGNEISVEYLELKSTKNDKIPGSSVQQVDPNEWVLFIKHTNKGIKSISGKYKDSISGTMQFPDRSPRPQVSFAGLQKWIEEYRVFCSDSLIIKKNEEEKQKEDLLNDWQGVLVQRWLNVLLGNKKQKEPWFNNNLRKFAIELLNYYDSLNDSKRKEYKNKIKENIVDEE